MNVPANRSRRYLPAGRLAGMVSAMKLLLFPAVDSARHEAIVRAAGSMSVINAADEAEALAAIPDVNALFGKITPPLLAAARACAGCSRPPSAWSTISFPSWSRIRPCSRTCAAFFPM